MVADVGRHRGTRVSHRCWPSGTAFVAWGEPLTAAQREALRSDARETRERARAVAAESLRLRSNSKAQTVAADGLVAASKDLRDRLRAIVVKHARLTRALGESPEQVIIEVKSVASAAADEVRASNTMFDHRDAQRLRDDLVRWTIDAYFGVGL